MLAFDLGFERRGLEHVPIIGDWLLRRRILRRIKKYYDNDQELW